MQHVTSALLKKKEELIGEYDYHCKMVKELSKKIHAIDESISIFAPEYLTFEVKPKKFSEKVRYFKKGEAHVLILDVLRKSINPLTTKEVSIKVLKLKNLDYEDEIMVRNAEKMFLTTLKRQESNGLIKSEPAPRTSRYWSIA